MKKDRAEYLKYLVLPALTYLFISSGVSFLWEDVFQLGDRTALSAMPSALVSLLCIPLFYRWYRALRASEPGREACKDSLLSLIFRGIGALLLGALLSVLWGSLSSVFSFNQWSPNPRQQALFGSAFWLQAAALGLLAPVCEELLFRGLIYTALSCVLLPLLAAGITSVLFGVFHVNPVQMVYAFFMGLCLQALRKKGGGIWLPIAFHMGANLASVLVMRLL